MRAPVALVCFLVVSLSAIARADDALDQARSLDQQGVRAYQDGRYKDAIVYFERAFKLGGPSLELWNIAKCHLKLDELEAAHDALDAYLARTDLSADDREEAKKQREALDHRTSPLTVTSTPTGARVFLDGKRTGATPLTVSISAGQHQVMVEQDGYPSFTAPANARFGRALVITADLTLLAPAPVQDEPRARKISIETGAGVVITRYAGAAGSVMPTGFVLATFSLLESEHFFAAFGARLGVSGDSWGTSPGVSNATMQVGCTPASDYTEATILAHAIGVAAVRITPRLRAGLDLGIGLVTSTASNVGGDVFVPQCSAAPGVQPAFHGAFDLSYRLLPFLRGVLRPLIFDVSPAYAGARKTPVDASGPWMRFGFTLGAAFDF